MSLDAATLVALAAALAGVLAYVAFGRGMAGKRAGARPGSVVLSLSRFRLDYGFDLARRRRKEELLSFFLAPFSPRVLPSFSFPASMGSRPKVSLGL